jgi:ADP-glucose pyrophosphorylase
MIADKVFYDHAIDLTGQVVSNCTFDGCIITVDKATPPTEFIQTMVIDCMLIGDGWPPEVLEELGL